MVDTVYKIATHEEWAAAIAKGAYHGSPDDRRDGFIHLSTADQLAGTAAKHFRGRDNLVLIAFSACDLGPDLKWEASRGGALFPHFYGLLDPALANETTDLALGAEGIPVLPPGLSEPNSTASD